MSDHRLFLISGFDCEPLQGKSPACGGPQTWHESEKQVLALAEVFRTRDLIAACGFHLTPEAAKAQPQLYTSLADEGFFLGIQPNIPGFRYPSHDRDLGLYQPDEQREIIRQAKEDFEEALGHSTTCYTACCGSRSNATNAILVEMGYREFHLPVPGRLLEGRPDRTTVGLFPFPHHLSERHRCLAGGLDLYGLPGTGDLTGKYKLSGGWAPADLRGEYPTTDETREMYRYIIDTNIELMELMDVPIKLIFTVGHNTRYCQIENVEFHVDYVFEAAQKHGLEVVPTDPARLHAEADRIGAF